MFYWNQCIFGYFGYNASKVPSVCFCSFCSCIPPELMQLFPEYHQLVHLECRQVCRGVLVVIVMAVTPW